MAEEEAGVQSWVYKLVRFMYEYVEGDVYVPEKTLEGFGKYQSHILKLEKIVIGYCVSTKHHQTGDSH